MSLVLLAMAMLAGLGALLLYYRSKERRAPDNITPALGYHILTPYYDKVVRLTCREAAWKPELVKLLELQEVGSSSSSSSSSSKPTRALDIGCGTGTLVGLIKRSHGDAEVFGLDADGEVLSIARAKVARSKLDGGVHFDQGYSTKLPYPDNSFDRVTSSLLLHHLATEDKSQTFKECHRVLKPGGKLIIADWGQPASALMRICYFGVQALDGFETTADNVKGRLPELAKEAGFKRVAVIASYSTVFGTLSIFSGVKA